MGQTADEIRQEIDAKRDDAASKIEQIEQKVTGTADQVKAQVTGLPDQLKEQVSDVTDQVKEQVTGMADQVKEQFDWRKQVDERPLVAVGAAFLSGVVLAGMLGGGDDDKQPAYRRDDRYGGSYQTGYPGYGYQTGYQGAHQSGERESGGGSSHDTPHYRAGAVAGSSSGGGLMETLRGVARNTGFERTINDMAGAFMATATDRIKQMAEQSFPGIAEKMESQRDDQGSTTSDRASSAPSYGSGGGTVSTVPESGFAAFGVTATEGTSSGQAFAERAGGMATDRTRDASFATGDYGRFSASE